MTRYSYRALDSQGQQHAAQFDADTRSDALSRLQRLGLYVIDLVETREQPNRNIKIGRATLGRFYSMLSDQLEVGVPLLKSLEVIASQEKSPQAQQLIGEINKQVTAGTSLSQALANHKHVFPELDTNIIRAGEEGGFLPSALKRVTEMREWQSSLSSSVWGALAYPLLLISVSAILVPCILILIVPKIEPLFDSLRAANRVPLATTILLESSHLLSQYGLLAAGALVGAILIINWIVPAKQRARARDRLLMQLPVAGPLVRDLSLARFFRVFGTLLQHRIPILKALDVSSNVAGNEVLTTAILNASEAVSSGRPFVEPLSRASCFPAEVIAMLGVGEQSNTLDSVTLKIASQMETRTRKQLELAVRLLEPLLLLIMALIVGFIMLALLLPVFEGQGLV